MSGEDVILAALTGYCRSHRESVRSWALGVGLACEDPTCIVCSADSAEDAARRWIAEGRELPFEDLNHWWEVNDEYEAADITAAEQAASRGRHPSHESDEEHEFQQGWERDE